MMTNNPQSKSRHDASEKPQPQEQVGGKQVDKRYELAIADLMQIPEDRFDDFLVDLKKWHKAVRSTVKLIDTIAEVTGEQASILGKMVWVDDGKHDGKIIITSKADTKVTTATSSSRKPKKGVA